MGSRRRKPLPFYFPEARHARREHPPRRSDYKFYKPFLRREFRRRCVYCCMPDGATTEPFHVDHYRPKNPDWPGAHNYENLFYSCRACNIYKGQFWPTAAQRKGGQFLPNPCSHLMDVHFTFKKHEAVGRTVTGAFAIECLNLNHEEAVEFRALISRNIERALEIRKNLVAMLSRLKAKIKRTSNVTTRDMLTKKQQCLREGLLKTEEDILKYRGESYRSVQRSADMSQNHDRRLGGRQKRRSA